MIIKSFLLLSGVFLGAISYAQVDTCWARSYGGTLAEAPGFGSGFFGSPEVKSVVDASNNIWVTCASQSSDGDVPSNAGVSDIWVLKIEPDGNTLLNVVIGGSGNDVPYDIITTADNGVIIAGLSSSSDGDFSTNSGAEDGVLIKLDAAGSVDWINNYGGTMGDFFFALEPHLTGYYLMGSTGSVDGDITDNQNPGSNEAWICKVDWDGNLVWSRTTSGNTQNVDYLEHFWDGTVINDAQDIIVQGVTGHFTDFNTDNILLVRYDSLGTKSWLSEIGSDLRDIANGIEYSPLTNEVIGTGMISSASGDVSNYAGGNGDYWLFSLDLNGNLQSEASLGGTGIDYPYSISTSSSNSLFVSGITQSTDGTMSTAGFGGWDFWAAEIDPYDFDTLQTIRIGGTENDYMHGIDFRSDNKMYAVGRSRSFDQYVPGNQGSTDVYVACLNVQATAGVENINIQASMLVSPNPFENELKIQTDLDLSEAKIHLMDVSGKVIEVERLKGNEEILLLPDSLTSGAYLLVVEQKDSVHRIKVVKQ